MSLFLMVGTEAEKFNKVFQDIAQSGRVHGLELCCRRFKSYYPDQTMVRESAWCGCLPVTQDIDGFETHTDRQF